MNIVFWLFVVCVLVIVWLALSPYFNHVGNKISFVKHNVKTDLEDDRSEYLTEENE